jgi:hypothetical protein
MINAQNILIGKPTRKSPLGKRRRKWVDNVNIKSEINKSMKCTDFSCTRIGTTDSLLGNGTEFSTSVRNGHLDLVCNYLLLIKASAPLIAIRIHYLNGSTLKMSVLHVLPRNVCFT